MIKTNNRNTHFDKPLVQVQVGLRGFLKSDFPTNHPHPTTEKVSNKQDRGIQQQKLKSKSNVSK